MSWKILVGRNYHLSTILVPGFQNELIRRSISTTTKCCDVYPSQYVRPIYRRQAQEEARELGLLTTMTHVPIRPAFRDHNQSIWHDPLISKFLCMTMIEGRKQLAREQVDKAFEIIKRMQLKLYHEETNEEAKAKIVLNPFQLFHMAIKNIMPSLETVPIKRGGHTYHVPIPVTEHKAKWRAMKWLLEAANDKDPNLRFHTKLAWEILDAANDTGRLIKRKQDVHKLCEANRAYAHFRWS